MKELVTSKVFGKEHKSTIYYMTGYGMTIKRYGLLMRILAWSGYRVVAFEYDRSVLVSGEPRLMTEAIDAVIENVKNDMKSHTVAGVYGISLGTMFAYNVMKLDGVDKALFSAGGCPLLRAVWDVPADGPARRNFLKNGYDRSSVQKLWKDYDITPNPRDLEGKELLLMVSKDDQVIPYDFVSENIKVWQGSGGLFKILTTRRLSHPTVIIRNALRIRKTTAFYRH